MRQNADEPVRSRSANSSGESIFVSLSSDPSAWTQDLKGASVPRWRVSDLSIVAETGARSIHSE